MQNIRDSLGLATTPRPCDWFDFIGGSGTGGYEIKIRSHLVKVKSNYSGRLIAILLGRLGLTVDECYRFYYFLARHGFQSKRPPAQLLRLFPQSNHTLSSKALEDALVAIVQQQCKEERCKNILRQKGDCPHISFSFAKENCCKT